VERPWIIALKAEVTAEDVDAAMAAGCNDLLAHIASQQDMMAALESADRALHDHGNHTAN
jgi:CheY-like chemotaxis protein